MTRLACSWPNVLRPISVIRIFLGLLPMSRRCTCRSPGSSRWRQWPLIFSKYVTLHNRQSTVQELIFTIALCVCVFVYVADAVICGGESSENVSCHHVVRWPDQLIEWCAKCMELLIVAGKTQDNFFKLLLLQSIIKEETWTDTSWRTLIKIVHFPLVFSVLRCFIVLECSWCFIGMYCAVCVMLNFKVNPTESLGPQIHHSFTLAPLHQTVTAVMFTSVVTRKMDKVLKFQPLIWVVEIVYFEWKILNV